MRTSAILSYFLLLFHNLRGNEDNWIEPHAWSELATETSVPGGDISCQCEAPNGKSQASVEDQLALTYFKKFVNSLFSSKNLKYGQTAQHFRRSMLFTLLPSQVNELEAVEDVRDLDIMLNKILEQAQDMPLYSMDESEYSYTHKGMGFIALIADIFKDLIQLVRISEVKFLLTFFLAIAIGCFIRKRYRIPVIVIILGSIFTTGYLLTYLECNRKLEVEAMIEVIENNDQNSKSSQTSSFFNLFGFFSKESTETKLKQKLLKSSKLNLPFCLPHDVLIEFGNTIFLKQMEMLLEKTIDSLSRLNNVLSFPFNILAPFALVSLICYVLKLTFKYIISPKVWMGVWHKSSTPQTAGGHEALTATETGGDRVSGENLKMLLNVINASSITQIQQQQRHPQQAAVSGVQELLETLEAPPKAEPKSKSNSANNSKENLNTSRSSADIAQEAGFTVVDDVENDDHGGS